MHMSKRHLNTTHVVIYERQKLKAAQKKQTLPHPYNQTIFQDKLKEFQNNFFFFWKFKI